MSALIASPPSFPSLLDAILHYYPVTSSSDTRPTLSSRFNNPESPSRPPTPRIRNVSLPHSPPYRFYPYPYPTAPSRFLKLQSSQVHAPVPRHHQTVNKKSAPKQHPTHGSMDRHFSKSLQDEPFGGSGGFGKQNARLSPSPSRHHHQLTALSPLQAFSPLQSTQPLRETSTNSEYRSGHGRSRSNSITKSLSRRQSLIINAERWGKKEEEDEYDARGDAMSLFSRLTLVKAPVEAATLKR